MELIGSMDVIRWDFGLEVGPIMADFCHTTTTILTKHESQGPNDPMTLHFNHNSDQAQIHLHEIICKTNPTTLQMTSWDSSHRNYD
jgi:hypothetical protein